MSSEENKSKSDEINELIFQNQKLNSPTTIIKEENPSNEKQIKQELTSSKKVEQKNVISTIQNSNNSNNKDTSPPIKFQSFTSDLNSSLNDKKLNFFKSKKVNLFDKKENIEKLSCNCTKTKCIKKYCECFANNRYCKGCNCVDCMNKYIYSNNNNNNSSKELSENEEIFCTCAKINCNKKYCECYKLGKKCNDKCRCVNCLNSSYPIFNINNKDNLNSNNINNDDENNENKNNINDSSINKANIELYEKKSNSRKSSSSDELEDTYQIQRVSIFINKYQTLVNVEKFSKEDMMLISKKRYNSE